MFDNHVFFADLMYVHTTYYALEVSVVKKNSKGSFISVVFVIKKCPTRVKISYYTNSL